MTCLAVVHRHVSPPEIQRERHHNLNQFFLSAWLVTACFPRLGKSLVTNRALKKRTLAPRFLCVHCLGAFEVGPATKSPCSKLFSGRVHSPVPQRQSLGYSCPRGRAQASWSSSYSLASTIWHSLIFFKSIYVTQAPGLNS